jgi:MFS family permease
VESGEGPIVTSVTGIVCAFLPPGGLPGAHNGQVCCMNETQNIEPRSVWRTPRTRGLVTGFVLVLLGIWGAVIPFVGPYFDYTYTPDEPWTWTAARGTLQVLPGAVAVLAGLLLLLATHRVAGQLAGWLGVAAGAWFVLGPVFAPLLNIGDLGLPIGGRDRAVATNVGMFYGLGAVMIAVSAAAVGRFSISGAKDVLAIHQTDTAPAVATDTSTQRSDVVPDGPVMPGATGRTAPPVISEPPATTADSQPEAEERDRAASGRHHWSPRRFVAGHH